MRRLRLSAFSRAPAYVAAVEGGLFAAEGLEIDYRRATDSATQLAGLLAGEYEVAHTAADNVVARVDAGADLRIALIAEIGTDQRLVGGPAVRTLADVAGGTLGVDAVESGHALFAYALLAEAGVGRDRYRVLAVGATPQRQAAMLEGRIDAAMLSPEYDAAVLAAGCRILAEAAARFPDHPGLTVAVRGAWGAADPEAVTAYCRAILGGARAVAARGARRGVPTIAEMTRAVEAVCALRNAVGLRSGPIDASRYLDASCARAAGA